ncbi:MAG: FeoA family protein [Methanoregulaceae archaeon]|jgi:ferrous iron transport protein A
MNQNDQMRKAAGSPDILTTLDKVPPPTRCRVVSVPARGPIRKRLLAMGFVPGTGVEVLRAAPLGDPVEYRVKGYCISLRREEAKLISVSTVGEGE